MYFGPEIHNLSPYFEIAQSVYTPFYYPMNNR